MKSLPEALAQQSRANPARTFLRTADGSIDYLEANHRVDRYAGGLGKAGIGPGDRVVLFMENGIEQVLLWLALNRLGAVSVPVNSGLVGDVLVRAVRLVRPAAAVGDADLVPALGRATEAAGLSCPILTGAADLEGPAHEGPFPVEDPLAPAVMLFTSGSTGVPKACVLSHHYLIRQSQLHAKYLGFHAGDVLYTPFPLFHIDAATLTTGAALVTGATAALARKFSASGFWGDVRRFDATVFNFMGATANILWKQPPSPADRDHRVRMAWGVPLPVCAPRWEERFGFPLVEVYGLTDAGVPAYQPLDAASRRPGSCGRIIDEYQVRIADGAVGEILIRSDEPGLVMNEYFDMPEATQRAFRDGWFHTGDLGRLDDEGNLYFVARGKEVIRRRGENIAASDIEEAINRHPDVMESAAIGVPSELSEDDVKACVVPRRGTSLGPADVLAHCRETLPRHMVPRYIEIMAVLPKTPTEKIERFKLAAEPFTPTTWEADGP